MTVPLRGNVPKDCGSQTAQHITERLQALERESAGRGSTYVTPATPTFGAGTVTGGAGSDGGSGGGTPSGLTDHGALTGLLDDDHPQYAQHGEPTLALPHQHGVDDVPGLEHRFLGRLEKARALPHTHTPEELDLDSRFSRRGERMMSPHPHIVADISDLRPDDEQFILAFRMFGG